MVGVGAGASGRDCAAVPDEASISPGTTKQLRRFNIFEASELAAYKGEQRFYIKSELARNEIVRARDSKANSLKALFVYNALARAERRFCHARLVSLEYRCNCSCGACEWRRFGATHARNGAAGLARAAGR